MKLKYILYLYVVTSSFLLNSCGIQKTSLPEGAKPYLIYSGELATGNTKLQLVFKIYKDNRDSLIATMDSPNQGAMDIAIETVSIKDSTILFDLPRLKAYYTGTIQADSSYKGFWVQGGKTSPLNIFQMETQIIRKRPQEPKPPFPYKSKEITFVNSKAAISFAATLTIPEGKGPFPCTILITGSGPQNRDEEIKGNKPFLVLADHFTRNGIAVLRYDKRGVGDSGGDFSTATIFDFADDVSAAVEYIKTLDGFSSIGLVGHSEGGLIAPIVANKNNNIDFIVLMAGPGLTGKEILELQSSLIIKQMGISSKGLEVYKKTQSTMLQIVVNTKNNEETLKKLSVASKIYSELSEEDQYIIGYDPERYDDNLKVLVSPWMRTFLSFDPRSELEKVKTPVLAIIGEKDMQVPPQENLSEISAALIRGGNMDHEIHELKNLNHLFQTCETGAPAEYIEIEETFNVEAMNIITKWIQKKGSQ